jgi:hypothetical protein
VKVKKKDVTQEDIEKKTEELIKIIREFKGSQTDAALHVCFEVVNWISSTHFEALGILSEAMFSYRKASLDIMNEENDKD